ASVQRFQGDGDEFASRREDDRRVEFDWRFVHRAAYPCGAEFGGELLVAIAIARHDVNVSAARAGHLYADVAGGAEPVDAEPRSRPTVLVQSGQPKSAIADDASAKQRRGLQIVEAIRDRIGERGGRDRIL